MKSRNNQLGDYGYHDGLRKIWKFIFCMSVAGVTLTSVLDIQNRFTLIIVSVGWMCFCGAQWNEEVTNSQLIQEELDMPNPP